MCVSTHSHHSFPKPNCSLSFSVCCMWQLLEADGAARHVYILCPNPRPDSDAWDAKKLIKNQRPADRANIVIIGNTCKVADGRFQADTSSVVKSHPPIWRAGAVGTLSLILSLSATQTHTKTFYRTSSWSEFCVCVLLCESQYLCVRCKFAFMSVGMHINYL